jgi:penicillin-binding protein 2
MTARLANGGRAVQPHLTRGRHAREPAGAAARDLAPPSAYRRTLAAVMREAMSAVVNEQGGTAYRHAADPRRRHGRWPARPAPPRCAGSPWPSASAACKSRTCPGEYRPHALFVAYAPHDAPRYALSVVVEHGNAGSEAAAPIARDIMAATLAATPRAARRPRVAEAMSFS